MGLSRWVTYVVRRAVVVGDNGPFSLGINPISFLLLHVDGVVAGAAAVGVDQPFTDIDRINITFNGASVWNINGEDIRAALMALGWRVPYVLNHASATNGDIVRMTIPVPFSRKSFWLNEGFPASRKGELEMRINFSAEGATFQTRNFTIEGVEVLDMVSTRFLKVVELSKALTAGDPDFELPIGNDYAGILIFQPAVADAGVGSGTISSIRMLLDNVEFGIANARYESLRAQFESRGGPVDAYAFASLPQLAAYAYIDFDPNKDGEFLVPTIGRSSIKLRPEIDNAGTVRVHPVELVRVETAQPVAVGG